MYLGPPLFRIDRRGGTKINITQNSCNNENNIPNIITSSNMFLRRKCNTAYPGTLKIDPYKKTYDATVNAVDRSLL